uniref:Glucokinase (hexokinase 4) regulator n=1 Tax=Myripristis murdjan TaxID=586833 RepID=A0A667WTB5_9TELE
MAGSGWDYHEPWLPVSEKSNPLTRDVDRASANQIVRLLKACDAQMFQAEAGTSYQVRSAGEGEKQGEGTGFNRALKELSQSPLYSYIIAGGDRCLLVSGALQLCEGKRRVLFIGISCGLSAPFVAGQLDFCLQHLDVYTPVLVGFNPAFQARCVDEPMPGCSLTFRSVVDRMQELATSQKAFLLNPTVGPEAISGSSRMKGGSATKILLETVLSAAHKEGTEMLKFHATPPEPPKTAFFKVFLNEFLCTFCVFFALKGPEFCISHEDFVHLVLPSLTDQDTILLIYTHTGGTKVHTHTHTSSVTFDAVKTRPLCLCVSQQWELSTKLVLNAVSTGAHVLKGKIYQNHMIDVQVTNSKLYRRATRLLQRLSGHPEAQCEDALLKAVYRVDELTPAIASSDLSVHTHTASTRSKVEDACSCLDGCNIY